jgi:hypothetical protein
MILCFRIQACTGRIHNEGPNPVPLIRNIDYALGNTTSD